PTVPAPPHVLPRRLPIELPQVHRTAHPPRQSPFLPQRPQAWALREGLPPARSRPLPGGRPPLRLRFRPVVPCFRAPDPLRRCRSRADGGPGVLLALGARAAPRPGNEAGMCPGINGFTKYAPIADWLGGDRQLGHPVSVPVEATFW